ncbi:hypothetical protein F4780DRAFT_779266 [Xylariomycetidae sp. FL0641]|nr:hypothetical protein F4780DRAFT_779266 [Xylariomycetidae sp. FL0641]
MLYLSGFLLFGFCLTALIRLRGDLAERRRQRVLSELHEHRCIADFSAFGAKTLTDRLRLRAAPNTRLVTAFRINSSFTTCDEDVHGAFLLRAQAILKCNTTGWTERSDLAQASLDVCIEHFIGKSSVMKRSTALHLAPLTRVFTFVFVLNALFGLKHTDVDLFKACRATDAINRLWQQSKDKPGQLREVDRLELQHLLANLTPGNALGGTGTSSPINMIMPAYETMWRVVLATFISAAYRQVTDETATRFEEMLRDVPACFEEKPGFQHRLNNTRLEKKALTFAMEGLRLYPPTKRIYRARNLSNPTAEEVVAADVERWHREPMIWGPDALEFRPSRFDTNLWRVHPYRNQPLPAPKRDAYMPFGVGKNMCPAASGFGYRAIVLLVATLARNLGTYDNGLRIRDGDAALSREARSPLPSGRQDMENWLLCLDPEGLDDR